MRTRILLPFLATAILGSPAVASADFPHTVVPGESLTSVAAADGLSIDQIAAANGISPDSQLLTGTTLFIPPQGAGVGQAAVPASTSSASSGDNDADSDDVGATASAGGGATGSAGGGGYVVQPGDSLSAIAARAGISVAQLAAANGLDPNGLLLSGSTLTVPGAGGSSTAASGESEPVGAAAEGVPSEPPYPTPERVSASEVGSIANANGVPPSLAEAIGWQESGFNNDLVSVDDARGVMQILPGTWQWIQQSLTPNAPLAPASAASNVTGGVLMLHSLLGATGGSSAEAAAGYYQGLSSVQQNGLYPDTQQYVNDVMSLAQQFGGG